MWLKKSEEALEKCFLTIRVTPKHEINSVDVLIHELPELMFKTIDQILKHKAIKLQIVLLGDFSKFCPATGKDEYEKITVPSKNGIILREDEILRSIEELLVQIHDKIDSWDNN